MIYLGCSGHLENRNIIRITPKAPNDLNNQTVWFSEFSIVEAKMKEIQLSQGKVALVDDDDYEILSKIKWYAVSQRNTFYAIATLPKIKMHRMIMNAKRGEIIDHIDRNGLNNQKSNLRFCSNSENLSNRGKSAANTSGYKGISTNGRGKKFWKAEIRKGDKKYYLGNFRTQEEAARAYDKKARELHGEFAVLNFPDDVEPRQIEFSGQSAESELK